MKLVTRGQQTFNVPFEKLDFGSNIRDIYEDIAELALSIEQNGVRSPLRVKKVGEKYEIIAGHRRYKALQILKARKVTPDVPCLLMEKDATEDDEVIEMFVENDGAPLKPLEQANGIELLIGKGWKAAEIATRLGKSKVYISQLQKLAALPEAVKELIRNNTVSATYVRQQMQAGKLDELLAQLGAGGEIVEGEEVESEQVGKAKVSGKKAKVTAAQGKVNSLKELKRFTKHFSEIFPNEQKQETYEFIMRVVNNELSYDQILDYFTDEKTKQHETPESRTNRKNAKAAKAPKTAAKKGAGTKAGKGK